MNPIDYNFLSASSSVTPDTFEGDTPDYLRAANIHTIGNSGGSSSMLDPTTWGEGIADIGKFALSSLVSGANSFYNTGVAVNNWFGGDATYAKTADTLSNIDSDLGSYYQAHQQGIDLAGFLVTSLAPGLLGIKALNAGADILRASKTGIIGKNISEATGLLVPTTTKYITAATGDFIQAQSTFSLINSNVLKALGSGVGKAALESAAFEVAVNTAMYKSPILDSLSVEDRLKNMVTGVALGGSIGGIFSGIKTYGAIKTSVKAADKDLFPVTHINEFGSDKGMTAADNVMLRFENLDTVRNAEVTSSVVDPETLLKVRTKTEERLKNLVREDIHAMVPAKSGEVDTANLVTDVFLGLDKNQIFNNMKSAQQLGRMGNTLDIEREFAKQTKKLSFDDAAKLLESGTISIPTARLGYIKMSGADAGNVVFDQVPRTLNLADTAPLVNGTLKEGVDALVKGYKFKPTTIWEVPKVPGNNFHLEAEARYIYAKTAKVTDGMTLHETDIPMMERVYKDWSMQERGLQTLETPPVKTLNMVDSSGNVTTFNHTEDLYKSILVSKKTVANALNSGQRAGTLIDSDAIAKIVNVRRSVLEGHVSDNVNRDFFAAQSYSEDFTKGLVSKGIRKESAGPVNLEYLPSYIKASYSTKELEGVNNFELEGMAYLQAKEAMHRTTIDNVVAPILGEDFGRIYHPGESVIAGVNRYGAGAGIASNANGGYHTAESWAEHIGAVTLDSIKKAASKVDDIFTAAGVKLINNSNAAVEYSAKMNLIESTGEHYAWNAAGDALIPRSLKFYQDDMAAGLKNLTPPKFREGTPLEVKFTDPEAQEFMRLHMDTNLETYGMNRDLRAAQGYTNEKHLANPNDPTHSPVATMYPIKPNPKDYPFIAYVTDDSVTGVGHVKMIHAATDKELKTLISKVPPEYSVHTNPESIRFHRAQGDYQYERTLHENSIDRELKRTGAYARFQPLTDPKRIVEDTINFHKRDKAILIREAVSAKMDREFTELRRLNEQYTSVSGSRLGTVGTVEAAERAANSPYLTYVKTALGISNMNEYPLLQGFNNILDSSFSRVVNTLTQTWNSVKSPAELDSINQVLKEAGVKTAYYDSAMVLHANHTAPKGELTNYIRGINSIISTLTLRTDPMNALNNAIGANVLYGAEVKHLVGGIKSANPEIAGELAKLIELKIPGIDEVVRNPGTLLRNAVGAFLKGDDPTTVGLKEYFKKNGWTTTYTDQLKSILDTAALKGTETSSDLMKKLDGVFKGAKALGDIGEKASGNKLAEEFNRFVAAHSMKQLTDLGIKAGVITDKEALSYINTFVNRTQGNMLASQRPLIFQGPIGQGIGLFQTYQFNLMQQLFRHVSEGTSKDAAFLLGLQGTIYGLNGLPAFNFINQHIVGTASGNQQHKDMYDATYGILGDTFGKLAMYGIPSNLLQANLYTRGDINPRHPSIIPVNPLDIPAIAAPLAAYKNIKDTLTKLDNGGSVWESLLQGIEHNGLSRPLAGFAQVAQAGVGESGKVFSTSTKGNLLYANDLWSWATAARLAGAKPLDEAVINEATYRITAYNAVDSERKKALQGAVKSSVIGGDNFTPEQVQDFAAQYASLYGGKQKQFNQWMMQQIKSSNTPRAVLIVQGLKSPMAQKMQVIMGGEEDFGF